MFSAVLIQERKGFTVVELMLVVIIIAILAAIAIPNLRLPDLGGVIVQFIGNLFCIFLL